MGANIPQAVRDLIVQYRRFLQTSYRFLDPHLRAQFEAHLPGTDVVVRGPFVTLARAEAVLKYLRGIQARYKAIMNDPSRFGMAKSFVMMGQAAGFDMTKQEDIDAFVATHNASLASGHVGGRFGAGFGGSGAGTSPPAGENKKAQAPDRQSPAQERAEERKVEQRQKRGSAIDGLTSRHSGYADQGLGVTEPLCERTYPHQAMRRGSVFSTDRALDCHAWELLSACDLDFRHP
jgi:hypothetical protein